MSKQNHSPTDRFLRTENISLISQSKPPQKPSQRRTKTSAEFQIHNLLLERKKLDLKVKTLENRIKHLESERKKSTLSNEIIKKRKDSLDLTLQSQNTKTAEAENKKKLILHNRKKRTISFNQIMPISLEREKRTSSAGKMKSKKDDNLIEAKENIEEDIIANKNSIQTARIRGGSLDQNQETVSIPNEKKLINKIESKMGNKKKAEIKEPVLLKTNLKEVLGKTSKCHRRTFSNVMENSTALNSSFSSQKNTKCISSSLNSSGCDDLQMHYIEYVPYDIIDIKI